MTHTSTAILRPVYQYYKKTYSGRPVTASRVSCVSIYPCAIYSSSEPVRLLCKSQNSPAELYVCTLLLLVGLGSFSTFSHKAFDLQQSRSESRGCRLGGDFRLYFYFLRRPSLARLRQGCTSRKAQ